MSSAPDSTTADLQQTVADLRRQLSESRCRLGERTAERDEAQAREAAIAEVLGFINSSPGHLEPVFDAMVERAARLCEADEAALRTFDGSLLHLVATHGEPGIFEELMRLGPSHPDGLYEAIALGEPLTHIIDVRETEAFRTNMRARERLELRRIRSWLAVALRKDGALLGVINVHRHTVRPFTDKQIALLQNFAAQAVIAMENARLITETREALEQQTATAEILRVISGSPTDLRPTFDAIAESATTLCAAASGGVFRFDGSLIHLVAHYSWAPDELEAIRRIYPHPPGRGGVTARAIQTRSVAHVADTAADPEYAYPGIAQSGLHAVLSVPMLRDGNPIGAISVTRREVEPFSETQIELLKTFADQAVIAIENVRLFDELRDRTNELAQRQAELRVTFDNMADGVIMFDEDLRLAAWNRNFQELLDLPDALLEERPSYSDYVHNLAARGEFGTEDIKAEVSR